MGPATCGTNRGILYLPGNPWWRSWLWVHSRALLESRLRSDRAQGRPPWLSFLRWDGRPMSIARCDACGTFKAWIRDQNLPIGATTYQRSKRRVRIPGLQGARRRGDPAFPDGLWTRPESRPVPAQCALFSNSPTLNAVPSFSWLEWPWAMNLSRVMLLRM